MKHTKIDVKISWHGSVFLFTPLTQVASEWIQGLHRGWGAWQLFAGSLIVDQHYAAEVVREMQADGLEVANGKG